jgi:hypothetical protein
MDATRRKKVSDYVAFGGAAGVSTINNHREQYFYFALRITMPLAAAEDLAVKIKVKRSDSAHFADGRLERSVL